MASIPLAISALTLLKKSLRTEYPDVRSSHLTEAIAAALGRKSHAALLADLSKQDDPPDYDLLIDEDFDKRLQEFGYPADPEFSFEWMDKTVPEIISTIPLSAFDIEYRTERERAWRNLMVCAINEGLRQKLFTLLQDNYNWAPQEEAQHRRDGRIFEFSLPNGLRPLGMLAMLDLVSYLSTSQLIQPAILFKHLMPGSLQVMHSRLAGLSVRKVLGFKTPRINSTAARHC